MNAPLKLAVLQFNIAIAVFKCQYLSSVGVLSRNIPLLSARLSCIITVFHYRRIAVFKTNHSPSYTG